MRRYLATASMAATLGLGENALVLFGYVARILRVLLLLAVWRSVFDGRGPVGGLELADVLSYTVVGAAFWEQLDARTRLSWSIWEGTVMVRLLRPVPVFGDYLAEAVGGWAFTTLTFTLPVLLFAPLVGVRSLPASPAAASLFALSFLLAIAVATAIDFLWGLSSVWLDQSLWSLDMARGGLTWLLSGALIPLPLLPWGLGDVLGLSPFASTASAPLLVYVGRGSAGLVGLQALWVLVLWAAVARFWRASAVRMISHGG